MKLHKFRAMRDLLNYIETGSEHAERHLVEQLISRENKNNQTWHLIGYCKPCEKSTLFLCDWQYSDGITPNFRERLVCIHCGLNNRQRFMAGHFKKLLEEGSDIFSVYLYEQVTQFHKYFIERFPKLIVNGSEYLGYEKKSGEIFSGIRHEDALNLSFSDCSMDVIISNDVFEHVPDIAKAFAEAHRVLNKKGKLLFTVPFHHNTLESRQRAVIKNGKLECILPEHYHGNPVSEKGSLVFYDFGWDILEFCRSAGFNDAYILTYYSLFYGYIGEVQLMFVAEKD